MNFITFTFILLQASEEAPGFFSPSNLLLMGALMLTFWFFWIRPQSKKIKEQNAFMDEIGKGSKIVTMGGIHGKILKDEEHTYLIEIDANTKLKISKTAVSKELTKEFYGEKKEKNKA